MNVETSRSLCLLQESGVDETLLQEPSAAERAIPVDLVMKAVEEVRGYVSSRLARAGQSGDVDDVLQEIRLAAWDGLARGHYRERPGIRFNAWVQGVARNCCASHIRTELNRATLPLFAELEGTPTERLQDPRIGRGADQAIDQEWARTVLIFTRQSVGERTWSMAVDSLTGPRRHTGRIPEDRRRWRAVSVVRQTASTVRNALDHDPVYLHEAGPAELLASECLPTEILRKVALQVVRPALRGEDRTQSIAAIASELQVSARYVAVQIGLARRLYKTALRILLHEGAPAAG